MSAPGANAAIVFDIDGVLVHGMLAQCLSTLRRRRGNLRREAHVVTVW